MSDIKRLNHQVGFTLIELMIVLGILAVIAAIALPSYNRYVIKNAESQAKSSLGNVQLELERWRATALTYRGFVPSNANGSGYAYDEGGTVIYVPRGANATNFRYKIELFDGATNTTSLSNSNVAGSAGRSWVMVATPNTSDSILSRASRFVVRSTGMRCKNVNGIGTDVTATSDCTESGQETW